MIIILKMKATEQDRSRVVSRVEESGLKVHLSTGTERTIIGVIGDERKMDVQSLEVLPGVERVVRVLRPFKLASREFNPDDTVVRVSDGVEVGGNQIVVMAGPCAVENEKDLMETAFAVKASGAQVLRGGAFKPRTSPYSFQGLGKDGLRLLAKARDASGLSIVTEVLSPGDVDLVSESSDILQVGARNMQNFALLHAVGESRKPVLLKRGMSATVEEWLMAAEYVLAGGNTQVILCERGIRTFETYTRNTMDVITGADELRVKESDRLAAMTAELGKMGARIEEQRDGVTVYGPTRLNGASVESHGDHRVAMALGVAGCLATGNTLISEAGCADISYPGIWDVLEQIAGGCAK